MKNVIARTKQFVNDHKTALAIVGGIGLGVLIAGNTQTPKPKLEVTYEQDLSEGHDLETAMVLFKDYGVPYYYDADNPGEYYNIVHVSDPSYA